MIGPRSSWDPDAQGPLLEVMGLTPEQAAALRPKRA